MRAGGINARFVRWSGKPHAGAISQMTKKHRKSPSRNKPHAFVDTYDNANLRVSRLVGGVTGALLGTTFGGAAGGFLGGQVGSRMMERRVKRRQRLRKAVVKKVRLRREKVRQRK